eukprot:2419436-Rhodomonas_salina.1
MAAVPLFMAAVHPLMVTMPLCMAAELLFMATVHPFMAAVPLVMAATPPLTDAMLLRVCVYVSGCGQVGADGALHAVWRVPMDQVTRPRPSTLSPRP